MRKFVKWGLIVCLALSIPAGLLTLPFTWSSFQTERYYRARPILREMRSAYGGNSLNSFLARDVLSARFPVGTDASHVVAALSGEGFGCQRLSPSSVRAGTAEAALRNHAETMRNQLGLSQASELDQMDCQLLAPATIGYTRWIIDMPVDDAGRLTALEVRIWHIFL